MIADKSGLDSFSKVGLSGSRSRVPVLKGPVNKYFLKEYTEMSQVQGTVKWFDYKKKFGFISPETGGADVFVHISAVEASGINRLSEGQRVSYEIESGRDGKGCAVNLRVI